VTISETLRTYVVDNFLFGQADGLPSADTSFLESRVIDSTGVLELISFLERQFAFRVNDEEIVPENLDSISKLRSFVERKLAASETETAPSCSVPVGTEFP